MDERPHNAQDGRCRYTLGAERCPAPGVVRVGHWWVCALHEVWAENPKDPDLDEEGRVALRIQQERSKSAHTSAPANTAVSGHGDAPQGPASTREAAMRGIDSALGGALSQAQQERRRRIGERAEALFSRAVRERRAAGVENREAILSAVREVACAAVDQRWGSGR